MSRAFVDPLARLVPRAARTLRHDVEARAKRVLLRHAPMALWHWRVWRGEGLDEEELTQLHRLVDPARPAVDVGASVGWFSFHLLRHAPFVYAFEPNPRLARQLAYELRTQPIRVEQVALSDRLELATLRVPRDVHQRASVDVENRLDDVTDLEAIEVVLRTLDSYALDDVGFIKVDVEGHELAALRGAERTLRRCRPLLLVEVEDRHRPDAVATVRSFAESLGYQGWFFVDGALTPIDRFDVARHQDPRNLSGGRKLGTYVNNFVYALPEHHARLGV